MKMKMNMNFGIGKRIINAARMATNDRKIVKAAAKLTQQPDTVEFTKAVKSGKFSKNPIKKVWNWIKAFISNFKSTKKAKAAETAQAAAPKATAQAAQEVKTEAAQAAGASSEVPPPPMN